MNITLENYLELQPDAIRWHPNKRLWNFLLLSFLLHLIIIKLFIDHSSQVEFTQPYKIIPRFTITLDHARPAARSEPDSIPPVPVDQPDEVERQQNTDKRTTPLIIPAIVPPETTTGPTLNHELDLLPEARELVEKTLAEAARAAREMEEMADPGIFMTNADKEKLQMASIMQEQQDPTMDNPDKLEVYSNQYGDRIFQTGDKCSVIPAVLFLYTFKEINSIIATPISCGNGKKESNFSLK